MQIIRISMVRLLYYMRRFADLVSRSAFLISFSAGKMIFLSLSDAVGKDNLHYKIHAVIQLIKERRNMKQNDYFIKESERVIQERTTDGQFYILYTDITDFHLVNYIYGNEIGDSLLQEMNHFLECRPNILLCRRLFADFFAGLYFLENGQEISGIISGLDGELQEFLTDLQSRYPACRLKAACGLCLIEHDDIAQAVDNANLARKISKNQYSFKTVVYHHSMKDQITAVHENELEIYNALHEKRFCFYLQPKVDLTNGMIIGAEALARRIGDDGTIIPPDKFMDLMEAKGSVIELDQIICRQVCKFLKDRIDRGLPVVCISVNLSRLHIRNPESADVFHQIVAEYGIPPELLEFELTETILLEEFAGAKHLIDKLRAYGHHVSIDDFGSGYAGINVWQELNFDCLKLDRKFLSDDEVLKKRNRALVPNIINIAHRLHVQVLCEGAETEEQCLYLLRLGCTVVQGFYFSKPLPPEELCQVCERQGGKYPLPALLCSDKSEHHSAQGQAAETGDRTQSKIKSYVFVILCCALFLGVCITGVMTVNRKGTQKEFTSMIIETLNAYTAGQRENTLTEIDGVVNTLQSFTVLVLKNDEPEFINTFLSALNKVSPKIQYTYYTCERYQELITSGKARPEDIEILERLKRGETVVTDIIYSERLGDIYCVGVGVPVMRDGVFIGTVQGIINAEALISTELFDPGLGEICSVFLTDGDSRVLPIREPNGRGVGERLLELLDIYGVKKEVIEELHDAYDAGDTQARSVRAGRFDGSPYYLSMTGLRYNDWYLVVCLKADAATMHLRYIVNNMMWSIAGLIAAVALVSAAMILFWVRVQNRISLEQQRYLLLEHFSDTVLFDYDCRHDTIRFTSNASKLLKIRELTQNHFLNGLDRAFIYAGDQEEVQRVLSGQTGGEYGEIRVRMMRPDTEEYFWCLVQYQNLYKSSLIDSIIGKITDIDERMPHE